MKKVMAAVMCMAMGLAVLAGCGNKAADTSSAAESSSLVVTTSGDVQPDSQVAEASTVEAVANDSQVDTSAAK